MRRLILFRHAKSAWPEGVADIDRPLNDRGRAAAPRMGAYLAAEGLRPDHVMVSPARRTAQTWEAVKAEFQGIESETVPSLYEAGAMRILDAVRSAPDTAASLLVIGHNPGLADLALLLSGSGPETLLQRMREKYPTAGVAVIDFAITDWAAVGHGGGRLERFVTPRGLADAAMR